jgi:hypothetical protein
MVRPSSPSSLRVFGGTYSQVIASPAEGNFLDILEGYVTKTGKIKNALSI